MVCSVVSISSSSISSSSSSSSSTSSSCCCCSSSSGGSCCCSCICSVLAVVVELSVYHCLSIYSIYLAICLSICKLENEAILQGFLNF